jgi:hypothetical protein
LTRSFVEPQIVPTGSIQRSAKVNADARERTERHAPDSTVPRLHPRSPSPYCTPRGSRAAWPALPNSASGRDDGCIIQDAPSSVHADRACHRPALSQMLSASALLAKINCPESQTCDGRAAGQLGLVRCRVNLGHGMGALTPSRWPLAVSIADGFVATQDTAMIGRVDPKALRQTFKGDAVA